jgi:hypothetical protein
MFGYHFGFLSGSHGMMCSLRNCCDMMLRQLFGSVEFSTLPWRYAVALYSLPSCLGVFMLVKYKFGEFVWYLIRNSACLGCCTNDK